MMYFLVREAISLGSTSPSLSALRCFQPLRSDTTPFSSSCLSSRLSLPALPPLPDLAAAAAAAGLPAAGEGRPLLAPAPGGPAAAAAGAAAAPSCSAFWRLPCSAAPSSPSPALPAGGSLRLAAGALGGALAPGARPSGWAALRAALPPPPAAAAAALALAALALALILRRMARTRVSRWEAVGVHGDEQAGKAGREASMRASGSSDATTWYE
jgi:hypothetical protein